MSEKRLVICGTERITELKRGVIIAALRLAGWWRRVEVVPEEDLFRKLVYRKDIVTDGGGEIEAKVVKRDD